RGLDLGIGGAEDAGLAGGASLGEVTGRERRPRELAQGTVVAGDRDERGLERGDGLGPLRRLGGLATGRELLLVLRARLAGGRRGLGRCAGVDDRPLARRVVQRARRRRRSARASTAGGGVLLPAAGDGE